MFRARQSHARLAVPQPRLVAVCLVEEVAPVRTLLSGQFLVRLLTGPDDMKRVRPRLA
jgi:hypothetical protein